MRYDRPRRRHRAARARPQRGAAIITALVVVALAAVLVSGLLWRQQVQIRRVENQRLGQQAVWVSRGAFDWTRLILRAQADSAAVTYLGGVWDVPIAETRLSDFIGRFERGRGNDGDATFLTGAIEDAQSRFNLRNLVAVSADGRTLNDAALAQFAKLLALLGIDGKLAPLIAQRMLESIPMGGPARGFGDGTPGPGGDGVGLAGAQDADRPLPITSLANLIGTPGMSAELVARLAPFVTVLPMPTPINLNTASAEVIAASVIELPLEAAQALVANREQAFFLNIGDAQSRLQRFVKDVQLSSDRFDVTTRFFFVRGTIRHERAELTSVALIFRDPRTHATRIVSVDES